MPQHCLSIISELSQRHLSVVSTSSQCCLSIISAFRELCLRVISASLSILFSHFLNHIAGFFSDGFITVIVVNPLERKLSKRTSVSWGERNFGHLDHCAVDTEEFNGARGARIQL